MTGVQTCALPIYRSIFAEGALDAAEWLAGRDAGWYDFFEVIDDA